ncbi:pancreatic lipase-related protein 2-like isoform X1 [Haemaphysalis longicornis]
MRFLPVLLAMTGLIFPEGGATNAGSTINLGLHSTNDDEYAKKGVANTTYQDLGAEDLALIARSVKLYLDTPHKVLLAAASTSRSFPDLPGTFDMSGNLVYFVPDSPDWVQPYFLLYSNKAKRRSRLLFDTGLSRAGFEKLGSLLQPGNKLYFIVHGFLSSAWAPWMHDMKNEILDHETNGSVVLVDWSEGCDNVFTYCSAAGNTRTVARSLAFLVMTLIEAGIIRAKDVHYIGHSLGAQAGGFFGQDVKELTGQLVGRITGLDPAAPLFEFLGVHLRSEHAQFVDALHTSIGTSWWWVDILQGRLGMRSRCGHVDFYPNGGEHQPGCWLFTTCSHHMAIEYYIQSISTCGYPTRSCFSYVHYLFDDCNPSCQDGKKCGHMGHPAHPPMEGAHFTDTTNTPCRQETYPRRFMELALG